MKQTKKGSFVETIVNILIGYFVSLAAQIVIFPLVGVSVSLDKNIIIGFSFTVVSIIRSYTVRRIFNKYEWFSK